MSNIELSKKTPALADRPAPARNERLQRIVPPCDVFENGDEYLIHADVPGVKSADFEVELQNGELNIRAKAAALGPGLDAVFGGRAGFEYAIRFRVPPGIDAEHVTAGLARGVLTLHLPKAESQKPKQIPVVGA